jgi:hypothetical protein
MVMRSLYFRVCGGVSHHGVLIARWSAWPPGGIAATGLDSIGDTGGMTGTCVDPFSRSAMTLPGLGQMNSPYERRSKPDLWPDHVCPPGRGARTDRGLSGGSDADEAERCGWINRALPDAELDDFVAGLARRIALFPRTQCGPQNRCSMS